MIGRVLIITLLFFSQSFGQRVVNVRSNAVAGTGRTADNVTVNSVSWSTNNGTITLSASVPATVRIGDIIDDSASNEYLITGISGSDLTAQDWSTTTDPATGAATIDEAYNDVSTWESELDNTTHYAANDTATLQLWDDSGDFSITATVTINGGGTVGLNAQVITVAESERHDGTANSGPTLLAGAANLIMLSITRSNTILEWFEVDINGTNGNVMLRSISGASPTYMRNMIVHDLLRTGTAIAAMMGSGGGSTGLHVLNCTLYDMRYSNASNAQPCQILSMGGGGSSSVVNNTLDRVDNDGSTGISSLINMTDDTDHEYSNNLALRATGNTSGTVQDFELSSLSNASGTNNGSSDTSAPGANAVTNTTVGNNFVSTTDGSEDYHLVNTSADAYEAGSDEGTSPNGVNIDIDGFNRNAGATTWSIGSHDGNNLRSSGGTGKKGTVVIIN